MIKYHKHLGVESKGKLKLHPITTQHTTRFAIAAHNELVRQTTYIKTNTGISVKTKTTEPEKVRLKGVTFEDGFVYVDLSLVPANVKGARIKLIRREGRNKRTVGVEFLK